MNAAEKVVTTTDASDKSDKTVDPAVTVASTRKQTAKDRRRQWWKRRCRGGDAPERFLRFTYA